MVHVSAVSNMALYPRWGYKPHFNTSIGYLHLSCTLYFVYFWQTSSKPGTALVDPGATVGRSLEGAAPASFGLRGLSQRERKRSSTLVAVDIIIFLRLSAGHASTRRWMGKKCYEHPHIWESCFLEFSVHGFMPPNAEGLLLLCFNHGTLLFPLEWVRMWSLCSCIPLSS